MANKYKQKIHKITFACGHTEKLRIGGFSDEYRQEVADRMAEGKCTQCKSAEYAAKKKAEREIEKKNKIEKDREEFKDLIIVPEKQTGEDVHIYVENSVIKLKTYKNEYFISIAKKRYFVWSPADKVWYREIDEKFNGTIKDRVIEISNDLLKSGFAVIIHSEEFKEIKSSILNADYEKEQTRWIYVEEGKLKAMWKGFNEYIFVNLKNIKTSKFANKVMEFDIGQYKQVLDFANNNGFAIHENVESAINEYINEKTANMEFTVKDRQNVEDKIETFVDSDEVIGDLIDE